MMLLMVIQMLCCKQKPNYYKSIEPSELKVRIYDNSAVVTMNAKVSMLYQQQPLDLNMRATFIWIKKNNDWQLVARQAVKIP